MSLKSYVLSAIQDVMDERSEVTVSSVQQSQIRQGYDHGAVNQSHTSALESRYANAENSYCNLDSDHVGGRVLKQQQPPNSSQSSDVYSQEVSQLHMKTTTVPHLTTNYIADADRNIHSREQQQLGNHVVGQQIIYREASTPSIRPIPNFNAMQDAETLQSLIYTANNSTSISFLCGRSSSQRQEISKAYQSMYGKDLIEVLISQLSQEAKAIVLALLEPVAVYDAQQLHKAMLGTSTQDSVLIECMTYMTLRSNQQLAEISRMYRQLYHKDPGEELLHDKQIGLQHHLAFLCASGETAGKSQNADNASLDDKLHTAGRLNEDTAKVVGNNDKDSQNSVQDRQIMGKIANVAPDVAVLSKAKELSDNTWTVAHSHASIQDLDVTQITAGTNTLGLGACDYLHIETKQNAGHAEVNLRSSDQSGRGTCDLISNNDRTGNDFRSFEDLNIQAAQTTCKGYMEATPNNQYDNKSVQISNESYAGTVTHNSSQPQFTATQITDESQSDVKAMQISSESYTGTKGTNLSGSSVNLTTQIDGATKDLKELHITKRQDKTAGFINESSVETTSISTGQIQKTTQVSNEIRTRTDSHATSQCDVMTTQISNENTGTDFHSGEQIEAKAMHITGEARDENDLHITGYEEFKTTGIKKEGQFENTLSGYADVQTSQVDGEDQNKAATQDQIGTRSLSKRKLKAMQITDDSHTKEDSHSSSQLDVRTTQVISARHRDGNSRSSNQSDTETIQVEGNTHTAANWQSSNQLTNTTQITENQTGASSQSIFQHDKTIQISGSQTEMNSRNHSQLHTQSSQITSESRQETDSRTINQCDARSLQIEEGIAETKHSSEQLNVEITSESRTGTNSHSDSQLNVKAIHIANDSHTALELRDSDHITSKTTQISGKAEDEKEHVLNYQECDTTSTKDVSKPESTLGGYVNAQAIQFARGTRVETTSFGSEQSVRTLQVPGDNRTGIEFQSSGQLDVDIQVTAERSVADSYSSSQLDIKSTQISNEICVEENSQSDGQLDLKTEQAEGGHTLVELQSRNFDIKTTQTTDESHTVTDSHSCNEFDIRSMHSGEIRMETSPNTGAGQDERISGHQEPNIVEIESMSKLKSDVLVADVNMQTDQYSRDNYVETASFSTEETTQTSDESRMGRDLYGSGYYDTDIRELVGDSHTAAKLQSGDELDIRAVQTSGIRRGAGLNSSSQYDIELSQNISESCPEEDLDNSSQLDVSVQSSCVSHGTDSTQQLSGEAEQEGKEIYITDQKEHKISGTTVNQNRNVAIDGHMCMHINQFSRGDVSEKSHSNEQLVKTMQMSDMDLNLHSCNQSDVRTTQVTDERSTGTTSHDSSSLDIKTTQLEGTVAESQSDTQFTESTQISAENRTETNSRSGYKLDIKTTQISGSRTGAGLHITSQPDTNPTQDIAESRTAANAGGNGHLDLKTSQLKGTIQDGKGLHITSYQEFNAAGIEDRIQSKTEAISGHLDVHKEQSLGESRTETTSSSSGITVTTAMSDQNHAETDSHSGSQLDVETTLIIDENSMGTDSQSKRCLDIETTHKTTEEGKERADTKLHSNQFDIKKTEITDENYTGTNSHSGRQLDVKVMQTAGESHTETEVHGSGQLNIRSTQNITESRMETKSSSDTYSNATALQISGRAHAEKEPNSINYEESNTTAKEDSQSKVDAYSGFVDIEMNQSSRESRTETSISSEQSVKTMQLGDERRTAKDAQSSSKLDARAMEITGNVETGTDLQSNSQLDIEAMQITGESHTGTNIHSNTQINVRTTEITDECHAETAIQSESQLDVKGTQIISKERMDADLHSNDQHDMISAELTGVTGTDSHSSSQIDIKTTQISREQRTGSCSSDQLYIKTTQVTGGTLPEANTDHSDHRMQTMQFTGEAQKLRETTYQGTKGAQSIETNQHLNESSTQVGSCSKSLTTDSCSTYSKQSEMHVPKSCVKEESSRVGGLTTCEVHNTMMSEVSTSEYCSSEFSSGTVSYSFQKLSLSSDDKFFDEILKNKNECYLQNVLENYQRENKQTVEEAIDSQFSGYVRKGLRAAVDVLRNRPAYFAKQLHQCLESHGTRDEDLLRLIVSRSEYDMVDIRRQFSEMYHASLESMIKTNCSIVYRDTLIALVNGNIL